MARRERVRVEPIVRMQRGTNELLSPAIKQRQLNDTLGVYSHLFVEADTKAADASGPR